MHEENSQDLETLATMFSLGHDYEPGFSYQVMIVPLSTPITIRLSLFLRSWLTRTPVANPAPNNHHHYPGESFAESQMYEMDMKDAVGCWGGVGSGNGIPVLCEETDQVFGMGSEFQEFAMREKETSKS